MLSFVITFNKAIRRCKDKFDFRRKDYGDSWKTCDTSYLKKRLSQEYDAWCSDEAINNLVDIVNFGLMILQRNISEHTRGE